MSFRQVMITLITVYLVGSLGWAVVLADEPIYWDRLPGWSLDRGFDTSAIVEPGGMHETHWSAWMATQAGLDPQKDCEVRTYLWEAG